MWRWALRQSVCNRVCALIFVWNLCFSSLSRSWESDYFYRIKSIQASRSGSMGFCCFYDLFSCLNFESCWYLSSVWMGWERTRGGVVFGELQWAWHHWFYWYLNLIYYYVNFNTWLRNFELLKSKGSTRMKGNRFSSSGEYEWDAEGYRNCFSLVTSATTRLSLIMAGWLCYNPKMISSLIEMRRWKLFGDSNARTISWIL